MPVTNLLLTIHVLGAIAIFGVNFAFPFIGAMAKKEGAPVAWALELSHFIETKWVTPLALTLQPASGARATIQPLPHCRFFATSVIVPMRSIVLRGF